MQPRKTRTKTQRMALDNLAKNIYLLEEDHLLGAMLQEIIPDAWHTLAYDVDVAEPKDKVTLYLDRSVAKFYRAMGKGYQARVNRILATFAQLSLAEQLDPPDRIKANHEIAQEVLRGRVRGRGED